MTTVAIVQTRMGSSRLPGKVLMDLAGRSALWHVLTRCAVTKGVDRVCCATTDSEIDGPVVAEAEHCGAAVFRGSEEDVLDRYYQAARMTNADVILRVTCDCPFIDPGVSADVLRLRAAEDLDFATNNMPPSWPHGLDCEVMTMDALTLAAENATDPKDRDETVAQWLRRNPQVSKANLPGPGGALAELRWALDYPADLEFFRAVAAYLPPPPQIAGWREIAAVMDEHPEIADINRAHRVLARTAPAEGAPA